MDTVEVDTGLGEYQLRVEIFCLLWVDRGRVDTVLCDYYLRVHTVCCLRWTRERLTQSYVITI